MKFLLKTLILLVLTSAMGGLGNEVRAQNGHITLRTDSVSLVQLFKILQERTQHKFVFNHEDAERYTVNISVENQTLEQVLNIALRGKPLKFEITDTHVIISRRANDPPAGQVMHRIAVSGTVTDQRNQPVAGVAVVLEGTNHGVSTDPDGRYEINYLSPEAVTNINFRILGMENLSVPIGQRTVIDVVMRDQATSVSEVVVTGYYTQSKNSYTGASRTITKEELRSVGNQNILTSLRNIDPSFVLMENNAMGSNPNYLPEFQIRGQSSLSGIREDYTDNPNMPLFILDGFEVTAEKVFDMDIYRVNSITILKDAAATAIYGSRAANGVVVITTVAPTPGRLYVNYNADVTFDIADLSGYDLLNAAEKLEFEKKAGIYSYYSEGGANGHLAMQDLYNTRLRNVEMGYDTYWLNKPINSLTVSHKHTLRIDGGTENLRYAIDANYNDQRGVMKESGRRREGIGMQLQYTHKNFTFSNEMTYSSLLASNSPYGSFSTYAGLNPYYRYTDDSGNYLYMLDNDQWAVHSSWREIQYNPLYNTTLRSKDESRYDEFSNNFQVIWDILPGWNLRGSLSITKQNNNTTVFKPAKHTDFADWTGEDYERRGYYSSRNGTYKNFGVNIMTSYQTEIGKNVFTANGVWQMREKNTYWESTKAEGFPNDNLDDLGSAMQYAKNEVPQSSDTPRRLIGFFASGNYIYDNRFMADITGRMDASSEFGSDNRWAPFWSVGAGWNLHREKFMEGQKFIDRLKLRATYGMTGSVDYDPYQALTTYKYLSGTRYHFAQGASLMDIGNDNLGWQKVHEQNYGFDLDMWNNRIQVTFNYYVKNSKDVLTPITLAPSTGFSTYMANLGEIENKGFDASVRVRLINDTPRGISLYVFGSAASNRNILRKISNSLQAYNTRQDEFLEGVSGTEAEMGKKNRPRVRYVEGASIYSIWVNRSLGIDSASGQEVFEAADGTTTTKWSTDNYVIGGCTEADVYGTFGFNFTYRKFRLNASFYYSAGGDLYNQTLVDKVQDADFRYNVDRRVLTDRWFQPGDISKYTAASSNNVNTNAGMRTKPTSRFIEKNNYVELTSINASYDIENKFISKMGVSQLRVTFYMNDVFRASTVQVERGTTYPYARNFSIGIQARF